MPDPVPEPGWVARDLAAEFPELALSYVTLEARPGRSPDVVRRRLRQMAGGVTGARVIHMRQDPVPAAYRAFWRQIGLDPDDDRTPVEQIVFDRLKSGGLSRHNSVEDALTIATLETGVALLALDAERVGEQLGLRLAGDRELLGTPGRPLSSGQIVVADEDRALALLGGEVAANGAAGPRTERLKVAALKVKGVPAISIEEALWTVAETLARS